MIEFALIVVLIVALMICAGAANAIFAAHNRSGGYRPYSEGRQPPLSVPDQPSSVRKEKAAGKEPSSDT